MENPMTWGKAERLINEVLAEHEKAVQRGVFGFSRASKIADALRREGLLKESEDDD